MKARSSDPLQPKPLRDGLARRTFLSLAAASAFTLGFAGLNRPAFADALDDARSAGTVGEGSDGYAVARDPSANALVNNTNAQRKAFYEKKAAEQGTTVVEIQAIYAQAIRERAQPGWWFQTRSGWQQK